MQRVGGTTVDRPVGGIERLRHHLAAVDAAVAVDRRTTDEAVIA